MDRETLSRGKRADNGKWIEGYFVKYQSFFIIKDEWIIGIVPNYARAFYLIEVIPSTVGRYTELTDRNGVKIFEGDILKGFDYPFCSDGKFNYFAEVVWFKNSPAFGIYVIKNPESDVRGISEGNTSYLENFDGEKWEIIGNIHDNPDLLGGDANA